MRRLLLLVLIMLIGTPMLARAATYWVSATGGTTAGSCGASAGTSDPGVYQRTIQAGVNCATAGGDIVNVKAGTYIQHVVFPNSGASGNPIVVRANPGDTVIWRSGVTVHNYISSAAVLINDKSHITIQGFTFSGGTGAATIYIYKDTGNKSVNPIQGIRILNNTFTNNGNASTGQSGPTRIVVFFGTGMDHNYSGATVNEVSGNSFTGNYGPLIDFTWGASDTWVHHNTATANLGAQNNSNGNLYQSSLVILGTTTINGVTNFAERNIVEDNSYGNVPFGAHIPGGSGTEISGARLDTAAMDNIIRRNTFFNLGNEGPGWNGNRHFVGIFNEASCHRNIYSENILYNINEACFVQGSVATGGGDDVQILNHVMFNCGQVGLHLVEGVRAVVKNNIISGATANQIMVSPFHLSSNTFRNNDYYNQGGNIGKWNWNSATQGYGTANLSFSQWVTTVNNSGTGSSEANSISADPLYVSTSTPDFHLQSTSPGCGTGEGGLNMGAYPTPNCSTGDVTPPSPPTNLQVTSNASHQITLTWTQGTDANGVTQNRIRWCTGAACTPTTQITISAATSYVHAGLAENTIHRYTVTALDAATNESSQTAVGSATTDATGLVGHWPCDEASGNCADTSGYGQTATLNGNASHTTGIIGANALLLDGTDDYAQVTGTARLSPTTQFGISTCVKSAAVDAASNSGEILSRGDSFGARILSSGNVHCFRRSGGAWGGHTTTGFALLDNSPHHVVCQYTGSAVEVYVDGNSAGSAAVSGAIAYDLGANLLIGRHGNGETTRDFNGVLDAIKVYDRVLTSGEISTDMAACTATPAPSLAVTHFRYHTPGQAENSAWVASEDTNRAIRVNGSSRWRFGISNTGTASVEQAYPLSCDRSDDGGTGYQTLTNDCGTFGICIKVGTGLIHGQSIPQRLTLPGGLTYTAGAAVMDDSWISMSLAEDRVIEIEYGDVAFQGLPQGTVVCCRPVQGDGSILDSYPTPPGDACLTVTAGVASTLGR